MLDAFAVPEDLRALDNRSQRTNVHRFVLIVDRSGRVVAREDATDPAFAPYTGDHLPYEVELLAKSQARRSQTHVLSTGCLVHVVPIRGTGQRLRALVFEQLRVRAE